MLSSGYVPGGVHIRAENKGVWKLEEKLKISYPCVVLNRMTDLQTRNDQYQTLVDPEKQIYKQSSEMSIEFEVDGPYRAMILPASKKKAY